MLSALTGSPIAQMVLSFLDQEDAVTITVCGIVFRNRAITKLALHDNAWPRPIRTRSLHWKAVSLGYWKAADELLDRSTCFFPPWVFLDALRRGDASTCRKIYPFVQCELHIAMEAAGSGGHLELVEWLYQKYQASVSSAKAAWSIKIDWLAGIEESREYGSEFVNWNVQVRSTKKKNNTSYRCCATRQGLLPKLPASSAKKLYPVLAYVASMGDIGLAERLRSYPATDRHMTLEHALPAAASQGHVTAVQWLMRENASSIDEIPHAMIASAQNGHLDVLQWLHDCVNAAPSMFREQEQLRVAALNGHLEVVQFLAIHFRTDITSQVFDNAASRGHLDVVQWLAAHTNSIPATIMRAAIAGGNVAMIRWLVEEKLVEVYRDAALHAAEHNHVAVLQWLYNHAMARSIKEGFQLYRLVDFSSLSLGSLRRLRSIECATWLLEHVPSVDPSYNARDLRELGRWYEFELQKELELLKPVDNTSNSAARKSIDHFLTALLIHRPEVALKVKWLPRWAVCSRSSSTLQTLAKMRHPQLKANAVIRAALCFTKDSQLMLWLLRHFQKKELFLANIICCDQMGNSVSPHSCLRRNPPVCLQ